MKTIKNILLAGAGAIGMTHAVKLSRLAGIDFRLAVDRERLIRYRRDGRFFNGERFDFRLFCPESGETFSPDLVIFATKSRQLVEAANMLKNSLPEQAVILPLLNGISVTERLKKIFPGNKVLYGYFIGHASVRKDHAVTHDGVGADHIGYVDNRVIAPEVAAVAELFEKAKINCVIEPDMAKAMWKKYILNVGVNQSSAFFEVNYGKLQEDKKMLLFAENLMREALAVAKKMQIDLDDSAISDAMNVILSMPKDAETSMYQDVKNSRPTEVDLFAGTLCKLAAKFSLSLPNNQLVLEHFAKAAKPENR